MRALAREVNFRVLGVEALVTVGALDPVPAQVVWLTPTQQAAPLGTDFTRADPRRLLAIRRDQVPAVPRGTKIVAPGTAGGTSSTWRVDGVESIEAEFFRVVVRADEGDESDS